MRLKPHSYTEVVKALGKLGFRAVRQRGSHLVLKGFFKDRRRTVVVPKHREIAVGTLRGIMFQAGLTVEEFLKLIEEA
ncbi:MAG: YcfA-like protein [Candidatus Bathyarchaeota archaeon BA1]|nr:MAG: YcfA-like protein [Candidatus Bathyarchaeota archaeon BA1]